MRRFLRVPTIFVLSKNKKNITNFHLKIIIFRAVKYCSLLHRLVFLMIFVCCKVSITPSLSIQIPRHAGWFMSNLVGNLLGNLIRFSYDQDLSLIDI